MIMKMGVIFIVAGVVLAGIGIYFVATKNDKPKETTYRWSETKRESKPVQTKIQQGKKSNQYAENKKKGDVFEDYLGGRLHDAGVKIISVNSNNHDFPVHDNKKPDLKVELPSGKEMYIECKYRTYIEEFDLTKEEKSRYQDEETRSGMPVYIALAAGDKPESPKYLFVIPLKDFDKYKTPFEFSRLCKYYIVEPGAPLLRMLQK